MQKKNGRLGIIAVHFLEDIITAIDTAEYALTSMKGAVRGDISNHK